MPSFTRVVRPRPRLLLGDGSSWWAETLKAENMQSQGVSAEVAVRLTPAEGACLFALLDDLLADAGRQSPSTLENTRDKLDDANALASWLREYVNLALHPEEALDLLECLVPHIEGRTNRPGETVECLDAIVAKLQTQLRPAASDRAAETTPAK